MVSVPPYKVNVVTLHQGIENINGRFNLCGTATQLRLLSLLDALQKNEEVEYSTDLVRRSLRMTQVNSYISTNSYVTLLYVNCDNLNTFYIRWPLRTLIINTLSPFLTHIRKLPSDSYSYHHTDLSLFRKFYYFSHPLVTKIGSHIFILV
jgi:hypothetical protein